MNNNLFWK